MFKLRFEERCSYDVSAGKKTVDTTFCRFVFTSWSSG